MQIGVKLWLIYLISSDKILNCFVSSWSSSVEALEAEITLLCRDLVRHRNAATAVHLFFFGWAKKQVERKKKKDDDETQNLLSVSVVTSSCGLLLQPCLLWVKEDSSQYRNAFINNKRGNVQQLVKKKTCNAIQLPTPIIRNGGRYPTDLRAAWKRTAPQCNKWHRLVSRVKCFVKSKSLATETSCLKVAKLVPVNDFGPATSEKLTALHGTHQIQWPKTVAICKMADDKQQVDDELIGSYKRTDSKTMWHRFVYDWPVDDTR